MASQLPGARAAIADNQGLPTPEFYRFLLGLQRLSAGSATSADIAALQTQITAIQSEIDGLPKSSFPTLQVAAPVYSQGLLQNGFAKIGVNVADSVIVNGVALQLDGDAAAPGNTCLYSTGLTGAKGWNALSGMLHQSANVAVTFGADGTATFDLQPLTDSGAGTFKLITRDSYGRLAGTKAGTTSDVPEGTNLYFTASRVLATVLAGLSTATSAVITAADTVLSALGKLQAQISANVTTLAGKLTAANNLSDVANAATARGNLGAEAALGNPAANGEVLSSTTAGVRSWAAFPVTSVFGSTGSVTQVNNIGFGPPVTGSTKSYSFGLGTSSPYGFFVFQSNGGVFAGAVFSADLEDGFFTGAGTFNGIIRPQSDNAFSCGALANRWSVVYAATGAINTSDAREKTEVVPLNADELAAAADMARAVGTYQWLASISAKGQEQARRHAGMTVQRAIEIMRSHNLDPFRYGFICYDRWDAQPEVWTDTPEEVDEGGNVIAPVSRVLVTPALAAGDRYSFRTDELNLFLARGFAARLDALEQKMPSNRYVRNAT